jgi:hypothetical protein
VPLGDAVQYPTIVALCKIHPMIVAVRENSKLRTDAFGK